MKGMTDSLRDLGEPVSDRTLVLNLLRGLNGRYDHLKTWITRTVPFPSFSKVRNDLILEEITKGAAVPSDTTTALYGSASGGGDTGKGAAPWPSIYNPWTGRIS